MPIINGQTSGESYVLNTPGSSYYNILPLLTVGDEVPLLEGNSLNDLTKVEGKSFALAGIPDGLGLYSTDQYNYVFLNHEISPTINSNLNSTSSDIVKGARMSLLVFDKNWNAVGGKNLIDSVVDNATGTTYNLNTTTGLYTSSNGETFSLGRFCSAYLAESGFEGGPVFFGPEESTNPNNRGWAVTTDGVAQSLDGLGRYAKENVVAASQYRATNSPIKKTVLLSTEDFADGELYMWVGEQTADDPNGFKNGDLYVLKVDDANFEGEISTVGDTKTAKWTKVDKSAVYDSTGKPLSTGDALSNFVNSNGNSTSFQRLEDIAEDPNNPGTFYFTTTGTKKALGDPNGADVATPEQAENPYGRLYRFTLNPSDPTDAISNFELLLTGGPGKGVSYDNVTVDGNGNVLLQEDETAFGGDVMKAEGRDNPRVWSYNIATGTVTPVFETDESIASDNTLTVPGQWETSGIIEADPNAAPGQSSYLFDVQAHSIKDSKFVEGGQLVLAVPATTTPGTAGDDTLYGTSGNDSFDGGAGNDTIYGGEGKNILLGGTGNDSLFAGAGDDQFDGGEGNNKLYGGEGNNIFIAGSGKDIAYAGAGNDVFSLSNGNNTIYAGDGKNRVSTGLGNDAIYTGAGDDIITAGSGNNTIYAGAGVDRIATGAGDDLIYGGEGNNTISAGTGNDTVYTDSGLNRFILDAGVGAVTIYGFTANDQISKGADLTDSTNLTFSISGNDTLISAGNDLLATLKSVQLNNVNIV